MIPSTAVKAVLKLKINTLLYANVEVRLLKCASVEVRRECVKVRVAVNELKSQCIEFSGSEVRVEVTDCIG